MSFWSRVRWRIGGSDPIANRLSDLIQKQIDAQSDANEVTSEEITNAIVTIPDKVVMRDHLFRAKLRDITTGINSYLPVDPDLDKLRLWFNNEHGGRYLTDHSFFNNKIQLNGSDQSALLDNTDDDGVSGTSNVNRILFDQYIRVEDNPHVRIKDIIATEEGITIFARVYVEFSKNQIIFNRPGVLFSKIDTEQVDYAYAAYLTDDNQVQFFVRHAGREFFLSTAIDAIGGNTLNLPDYEELNYAAANYYTISSLPILPDPIPYTDLVFTYKFADNHMQIIADGTSVLADSANVSSGGTNSIRTANMKLWLRMVEGGPIGTAPVNTIYDSSPNLLNGTAINPIWTDQNNTLEFKNNNAYVSIPVNTSGKEVNNLTTSFSFATWAKIDDVETYAGLVSNINGKSDGNRLLVKNQGADTVILWQGHDGVNPVNSSVTLSTTNLVGDGLWHNYAVTYDGSDIKIFLDGGVVLTDPQTYTLANGTFAMTLGWGSTTIYHLTGMMQDAMLWNTNLTDQQITDLYNQGRPISYFPKWQEDPPTEPPPPGPITNPFVSIYNVPLPAAAEQDLVKLHKITVTNLEEKYNVADGQSQSGNTIPETNRYQNDPTYSDGTTPVETLSYYNHMGAPSSSSYMELGNKIGGQRFYTGGNVIGKPVMKVIAKMADVNPNNAQATGTVVAKVIQNSNGQVHSTSNTIDVTTLADKQSGGGSTAWSDAIFTFTNNTYNMTNNDKIEFEYTGGGGGETVSGYNSLGASVSGYLAAGLNLTAHEMFTGSDVVGKVISKIVCKLCDLQGGTISTPGGNFPVPDAANGDVSIAIVDGNITGNAVATSNSVNATTLVNSSSGTSFSTVTFTFTNNTYVMQSGDHIRIQYNRPTQTGNPDSAVGIATAGNVEASGDAREFYWAGGGWVTHSNRDIAMDVYIGGSAAKLIGVARSTSGGPTNSNQYERLIGGSNSDLTSNDLYMQVYINSATGTPNHASTILANNTNKFVCEYVNSISASLYNRAITRAVFRISKIGNPTGTLFCRIRKGDNTNATTLGLDNVAGAGLNVSTLSTTNNPAGVFSFENDNNTYALQVGDRVVLELVGGTSDLSVNNVRVYHTHTVSNVANVHLQVSTNGTSWTNSGGSTNDDIIASMFSGGYVEPPTDPWIRFSGSTTRIAAQVTSNNSLGIFNKVITQVKVKLRRNGSPVGDIFCRIRDSSRNIVATIDVPKRAEDISTAGQFTQYTFTNLGQTRALVVGDTISIEYSDASVNADNSIDVLIHLSNPYPYANIFTYTGAYNSWPLYDLSGFMYIGGGSTDPTARIRVGEKVATTNSAIKLKKVSRVRVRLKRTGGFISMDPGLLSVRVRNSADQVVQAIGTINPLSVDPNTPTEYTFTSNPISVYALQVGDIITVEYDQGDDFNYVEVMTTKTTDGFDGVQNTYLVKHDGIQYSNNTAIDLVGRMDEGGDTFTPSQEEVIIPPPKYTKDLTILAGGNPWTYIDHSTSTDSPESQYYVNAVITDFRLYRKILTSTQLENIFINRSDQGDIVFGEVAKIGFFSTNED